MSTIEIIATISGLACVILTIRQNIWCWPTGLLMVALYIVIFYQAKLYSDMGLQVVYVVLQIYGWYAWLHGGPKNSKLPVRAMGPTSLAVWCLIGAVLTAALGYTMQRFTDASLPYWDATTTVLSLIAQFLMARKIMESWLLWITVDVLAIGIYAVKDLHLTAGLYAVFLVLATLGYFAWKNDLKKIQASPPAMA
jgi:nicotinamide mononucleotide transporter